MVKDNTRTGSVSIVSKEEALDAMDMDSEVAFEYPDESELELGLGLSLGSGGRKTMTGSQVHYARILTAEDLPASHKSSLSSSSSSSSSLSSSSSCSSSSGKAVKVKFFSYSFEENGVVSPRKKKERKKSSCAPRVGHTTANAPHLLHLPMRAPLPTIHHSFNMICLSAQY